MMDIVQNEPVFFCVTHLFLTSAVHALPEHDSDQSGGELTEEPASVHVMSQPGSKVKVS